ncbi:MAG: hypothetical protein JXB10_14950 [Pirellulales bacterium]|nr:hypothetical protein [Pirellulales bacterium]
MARIYGGILGLVAFLTTLARGGVHGNDPEATLWAAWLSLLAFTGLGLVLGWLGGWLVEDAIHTQLLYRLEEQKETRSTPRPAQTA